MKCENCEEIHDGNYGSGRFCSIKCSKSFSTKNNRKSISEKVSNTLKGRKSIFKGTGENYLCVEDRICKKCEIKFTSKRKLQKYCSQACARSHKTEETKEILRQKALERYLSGELISTRLNKIPVKDKNGKKFIIDKDDERYLSGEFLPIWKNKKHTDDTKIKIGEKNSISQKGEKNSQFGTCWITKEGENKKIKNNDIQIYFDNGWIKGRNMK